MPADVERLEALLLLMLLLKLLLSVPVEKLELEELKEEDERLVPTPVEDDESLIIGSELKLNGTVPVVEPSVAVVPVVPLVVSVGEVVGFDSV